MSEPSPAPTAGRLAGLHHVHHVQLAMPAGAEGVAEGFYGDLLGLVRVEKPAALAGRGGAWFRAPGGSPEVFPGRRRFHADDPLGNRLEFVEAEPATRRMT